MFLPFQCYTFLFSSFYRLNNSFYPFFVYHIGVLEYVGFVYYYATTVATPPLCHPLYIILIFHPYTTYTSPCYAYSFLISDT
jgi:hypothetical protein